MRADGTFGTWTRTWMMGVCNFVEYMAFLARARVRGEAGRGESCRVVSCCARLVYQSLPVHSTYIHSTHFGTMYTLRTTG